MIDIWLTLNSELNILSVNWENPLLAKLYARDWDRYVNQPFFNHSDFLLDKKLNKCTWNKKGFIYKQIVGLDKTHYLLLKKIDNKALLYEYTLNEIRDGIQVYDQNACILYMNKASRDISNIPHHLNIDGKHLFDLYDVDAQISTVMTSLRTRAPVINRFDNFKSTDGSNIVSVNTAYPIVENEELIGSIVFEQNLQEINNRIAKLESIKETIKEKTSTRVSKFNGYDFSDLIGRNQDLLVSIALAKKIAKQDCHALIVGETGTGKEIFAQSIHKESFRKNKKFVAINCAAVPETLVESVFFGTSKGSFTGSVDKVGILEEAHNGTLFLDELNSMSLAMQSKLLRVIQEGSFRRVGGSQDIQTDIRFISSCNENPIHLIEQNALRRDLFYRLSTITIEIPPLRNRKDDIDELVQFYLFKNINRYVKTINEISPQVLALFQEYNWPGNVRELFNILDYILNTIEGDQIEIKHLPKHLQEIGKRTNVPSISYTNSGNLDEYTVDLEKYAQQTLQDSLDQVEKSIIENCLHENRYNVTKAAQKLGLSRQSLQYRIKKLGIKL